MNTNTIPYHPSLFHKLTTATIKCTKMASHGGHGLSHLNSNENWRNFSIFDNEAVDLCLPISNIAIKTAAEKLYGLDVNKHCIFIFMNMNPLFRPIGVGDVLRRILSKRIVRCSAIDIKQLGGNFSLCCGQKGGKEFGIHSLRPEVKRNESEVNLQMSARESHLFFPKSSDCIRKHQIYVRSNPYSFLIC